MRRPEIFVATWDLVLPHARRMALNNEWRVKPLLDVDDLMGEAGLVFTELQDTYASVVDFKHFIALFNTSFYRRITDLSRRRMRRHAIAETVSIEDAREAASRALVTKGDDFDRLFAELSDAPPELIRLIRAALMSKRPLRRRKNGLRERTNAWLCRWAGVDSDFDLRGAIEAHLLS